TVAQASLSWNPRRGTLRGMHWQAAPHAETKLVRCAMGRIHDVLVDLRPDSPTYLRHVAVELSGESGDALYVPPGLAHGFLTLTDSCQVHYQMSTFHEPGAGRGARWNDPAFGIEWPAPIEVISERDRTWPDFAPGA
ncbi:MAG: dTDP-4-dehydrorhamnose 3,5-epimerase family protein, partial [Acidobacteria bacterium]|nr:dTDP-4-dehydrorhamnose 3,5-epimerase family protein [Acidobacteriota bacterium]